ncbi:hypothetical protein ARMSODRAFT_983955 [Armillaria solidipes]|uniref:Uncharacterized protein n=1 Tax=Armillaria solidipes TaxID=1076256 RepID=A0A2H3ATS1_9AGAR|nr:hypothetical protein ARMSODRAFT_983955 [Armillaria solidipes]
MIQVLQVKILNTVTTWLSRVSHLTCGVGEINNTPLCIVIWSYQSYLGSILVRCIFEPVLIMQQQCYVALGGPSPGLYDSPPPLKYDRILPITIKALLDIVDLLEDLVELFPEGARPDQMAKIIEHSGKILEVSEEIKSKIYCVLDGKTALGRVRMIFITDNFKTPLMGYLFREVQSFLNNGNTWKRETSLRQGLLYMLQNIQGAEPYIPITPPKPSASSTSSHRRNSSIPPPSGSRQATPTPPSLSTSGPLPSGSEITSLPNMRGAHERPPEDWLHLPVVWPTKAFPQWPSLPTTDPFFNVKIMEHESFLNHYIYKAQSVSKGKGRDSFRMPESQSTRFSSQGKGRARSQTLDSDSSAELQLEERVSRLEERFDSLGI